MKDQHLRNRKLLMSIQQWLATIPKCLLVQTFIINFVSSCSVTGIGIRTTDFFLHNVTLIATTHSSVTVLTWLLYCSTIATNVAAYHIRMLMAVYTFPLVFDNLFSSLNNIIAAVHNHLFTIYTCKLNVFQTSWLLFYLCSMTPLLFSIVDSIKSYG